ncbi:MAG: outer membrane beta-barrel protein [Microscillaceae bacterium]|nr:outer membrane beta-barrel protein [Microscillaceae bacterium]
MREEDKFADDFKKALEGAKMDPGPVVWAEIESKLRHRQKRFWQGKAWLLVILLGIGLGLSLQKFSSPLRRGAAMPTQNGKVLVPNHSASFWGIMTQPRLEKHTVPRQSQTEPPLSFSQKSPPPPFSIEFRANPPKNFSQKAGNTFLLPLRENSAPEDYEKAPATPAPSQNQAQYLAAALPSWGAFPLPLSNPASRHWPQDTLQSPKAPKKQSRIPKSPWTVALAFGYQQFKPHLQQDYARYLARYLNAHQLTNIPTEQFFASLDEKTQSRFSFSALVQVAYQISTRWQLRTGLTYQHWQMTQQTNAYFIDRASQKPYAFISQLSAQDIQTDNLARSLRSLPGYNPNGLNLLNLNHLNENKSLQLEISYQYLSLPLEVGYVVGRHQRWSHSLWGGTSLDLFLQAKYQNPHLGSEKRLTLLENKAYRNVSMSLRMAWQSAYQLRPSLSLYAQPFFQQSLFARNQSDAYLRFAPFSFGLEGGIQWKF